MNSLCDEYRLKHITSRTMNKAKTIVPQITPTIIIVSTETSS